ncbi:helix-turn-helix transcriptional regulator [Bengtsoniella intestinalis]|uniref:helix-turn-helix domain-containing protein n=1 Tax=Bengtsoniella intestinalis TaxID=3073143 RepID=UPI00391F7C5A
MKDQFYVEYKNLGLSVAYFRKRSGLTQQQVADKIDVSYETISRIENANTGITLDMLLALSGAIGVSLSNLFAHADL